LVSELHLQLARIVQSLLPLDFKNPIRNNK
jgi:hypothetical protein